MNEFDHVYSVCSYTLAVLEEVTKALFEKQRQCSEFYIEASYDAVTRITELIPQCKVPILPEIPQPGKWKILLDI